MNMGNEIRDPSSPFDSISWLVKACGIRIGVWYDSTFRYNYVENQKFPRSLVVHEEGGGNCQLTGILKLLGYCRDCPEMINKENLPEYCRAISYLLGLGTVVSERYLRPYRDDSGALLNCIVELYGLGTKAEKPQLENNILVFYTTEQTSLGNLLFRVEFNLLENSASLLLVVSTMPVPLEWSFPGRVIPASRLDGFWLPDFRDIINGVVQPTHPEVSSAVTCHSSGLEN